MRAAIRAILTLVLLVCGAAVSVQAATYYVAQEAPNASDENPGTQEQPWKSLAKAVEATAKGDTVYVKAGIYLEPMELTGEGVSVRAFGDDAVVLESADEITEIKADAWEKVPGQEFVHVCEPGVKGVSRNWRLQVDGLAVAFELTQGARREITSPTAHMRTVEVDRTLEDDDGKRWSLDREGKLYINLMGADLAEHRIELVKPGPGGVSVRGRNCHVKGLELRRCGLSVSGDGNVVEDCLVMEGSGSVGGRNIVRRCSFYRCSAIGIGTSAVFEENLVVGGLRWVPELQPPQVDRQLAYYLWNRAIGGNVSHHALIRYNVIADSALWGFWNDCTGDGTYLYGNSFWRNWSGGIYNEDGCHDTRILYNALVENAIYGAQLSGANRCLLAYNLCLRNTHFGIGLGLTRTWPNPKDNIIQHNLIKGSERALCFDGMGDLSSAAFHQLMTMTFDHNIYSYLDKFAHQKATLADFQNWTKMDQNSRLDESATMEDFGLGTVSFRIPGCDHPETPVPMVANVMSRGLHQEPVGQDSIVRVSSPLSWSFFSDGGKLPSIDYRQIWAPPWRWGTELTLTGGCSQGSIPGDPLPADGEQPFWMEVNSQKPEAPSPHGSGWWSTSLPTVPGAHIRVSLRVSREDLESAEGQAVLAFVRFSSFTDQHVSRQYLIGGDSETGVLRGTFAWQTFSREFVAPPEARRFAFFMGLGPAAGKVRFAAIRIETLPGEGPPQRPMPADVAYEPVDLSAYFNHDLDENVTARIGDGLKGTPGPMNLSELPRGSQLHKGVPFEIGRAIVLRGSMLPQDKSLPREVRGIRVGRRVAGLYFLHCFSYPAQDREQFRYVLHFADGDKVEIPVISGVDMVLGAYQRDNVRFFEQWPPHGLRGGGGLAEWVNPKPDVALESIDVIGADTGEPVVLGITATTKR